MSSKKAPKSAMTVVQKTVWTDQSKNPLLSTDSRVIRHLKKDRDRFRGLQGQLDDIIKNFYQTSGKSYTDAKRQHESDMFFSALTEKFELENVAISDRLDVQKAALDKQYRQLIELRKKTANDLEFSMNSLKYGPDTARRIANAI